MHCQPLTCGRGRKRSSCVTVISGDGSVVAFQTASKNLLSSTPSPCATGSEVFLRNLLTGLQWTLALSLVAFIGGGVIGLLVMVMISGYENFVSQLDIDESKEKLNWLGTMDSSSLKMKVAASIVAISSIHLLRIFMDAKNVDPEHLMWYVIIHMTFVVSAFAMGYLDKLTKH